MLGAAERIFARLAPAPARLQEIAQAHQGEEALISYVEYVVERLLSVPELALALVELRLEATRSASVAETIGPFLRAGYAADVEFHQSHGLPGGADDVAILHYLVDGILLDQLTVPIDPDRDVASDTGRLISALLRQSAG